MSDTAVHLKDGIGLWAQRLTATDFRGRPGLFLDRDGVVVEEVHHLSRVEDVELIGGVADAIASANRMAIPVVIVSNQSGIARGVVAGIQCPHHPIAVAGRGQRRGAARDQE